MVRTLFILGALAGAAALGATVATPGVALAESQLSTQDKDFVDEAAAGGLLEVRLGELAQQRAQSDDVKKFAQRMVDDHTQLNDQLAQLAAQRGITLPDKLDHKAQAEYDALAKLSGAQFDKHYMAKMLADHQHDVAAFQKQAKSTKDPQLLTIASGALPTLEEHLTMAKQVDSKIGAEK